MKKASAHTAKLALLFPALGCLAFLLLYLAAAAFYPGGSQADVHAKGFSWMHNYWCNLLNEKALNGESNAARPFAYAGMAVLLLAIVDFYRVAAQGLLSSQRSKNILLFSGTASMLLLPFLPTSFHDVVINASGFLGLVSMLILFTGLYKKHWYIFFTFGLFNLVLIGFNNYLYYATTLYYLPVVQKITFVSFLLWVILITVKIYRQQGET